MIRPGFVGGTLRREKRAYLWLFLLFLIARSLISILVTRLGYMDAAYYAAALRQTGGGFTEPFTWNYLNDPAGVPYLELLRWMPFPCLLAALVALPSTYTADEFLRSPFRPVIEFLQPPLPWFLTGWLLGVFSEPFIPQAPSATAVLPQGSGARHRHWITD